MPPASNAWTMPTPRIATPLPPRTKAAACARTRTAPATPSTRARAIRATPSSAVLRATGHAIHQGARATGHAIHRGFDKVTGK